MVAQLRNSLSLFRPAGHHGRMTSEPIPPGLPGRGDWRQVYRSNPSAPTADQLNAKFERLAGRV